MNLKPLLHYHLVSHVFLICFSYVSYIYLKVQQKIHSINGLLAELAIEA